MTNGMTNESHLPPGHPEHPTVTMDLDGAAYVATCGHQLLRVGRAANGRSTFVFPPGAHKDLAAFYMGAMVKAIDFGGALKMVKKAMFDLRGTHYTTRESTHDPRFSR